MRLKVPVLLDRIKTGAFFARVQVMMTNDDSLRKVSMHPFHQLPQGTNLLRRPCVAGFPSRIESTLIADADRMAVMPHNMGTHLFKASSSEDFPLSVHPEMIAYTLPTLGLVVSIDLLDTIVLMGSETIAMQHDHRNFTHILRTI